MSEVITPVQVLFSGFAIFTICAMVVLAVWLASRPRRESAMSTAARRPVGTPVEESDNAPPLAAGVQQVPIVPGEASPPRPPAHDTRFIYATGDRPLDGYTIKRGIGRGGFGEVYYAVSDGGKEVALKLVQRHLDVELRGVGQCLNLKHPNLLSIFDVRQAQNGDYWIVMEYVSGTSLADVISASPQGLPPEQAVAWLRGINAGVGQLHEHGIVHRDLKPGNIFVEQGIVKIGDYGLAKYISASRRSGQTESVGTVHYMAPEVSRGRYGKEIDLYALGVILYEMLSGRVPFDGQSPGEILMRHLTEEPDVRVLPEPYRAVVARLLAKDPQDRYASVQAMLEELQGRAEGRPVGEPREPAGQTSPTAAFRPTQSWQPSSVPPTQGVRASIRSRPVRWGLCVFLTVFLLLAPFGLFFPSNVWWKLSWLPAELSDSPMHWLSVAFVIALCAAIPFTAWAFLLRTVHPAGGLSSSVRAHPIQWTACVFLSIFAVLAPNGFFVEHKVWVKYPWLPVDVSVPFLDWVSTSVVIALCAAVPFCAWVLLWRTLLPDHEQRRASGQRESDSRRRPGRWLVCIFLTVFTCAVTAYVADPVLTLAFGSDQPLQGIAKLLGLSLWATASVLTIGALVLIWLTVYAWFWCLAGRNVNRALVKAARNGDATRVQQLLDRGADLNARARNGETALMAAARGGHSTLVQLLLERGADVGARDTVGQTALIRAAANGHVTIVKTLLERGPEVDARDSGDGSTALLWAAYEGHKGCVEALLEAGADINAKDTSGNTPLIWAAFNENAGIVQVLLAAGADPFETDSIGYTARDYASDDHVVELLDQTMARDPQRRQSGVKKERPPQAKSPPGKPASNSSSPHSTNERQRLEQIIGWGMGLLVWGLFGNIWLGIGAGLLAGGFVRFAPWFERLSKQRATWEGAQHIGWAVGLLTYGLGEWVGPQGGSLFMAIGAGMVATGCIALGAAITPDPNLRHRGIIAGLCVALIVSASLMATSHTRLLADRSAKKAKSQAKAASRAKSEVSAPGPGRLAIDLVLKTYTTAEEIAKHLKEIAGRSNLTNSDQIHLIDVAFQQVAFAEDQRDILLALVQNSCLTAEARGQLASRIDQIPLKEYQEQIAGVLLADQER